MPEGKKLKSLTSINGASGCFVPLNAAPKPKGVVDHTLKEYVVLSQGVPLAEATPALLQKAQTDLVKKVIEQARVFSLIGMSAELGILHYDQPLGLAGVLKILQIDREGVVGYTGDNFYSFYLDYDITGHVIEIDFPKNTWH